MWNLSSGNAFRSDSGRASVKAQKSIYIVDDDPGILKATGRLLKALGFGVQTFSSAEEFWACGDPIGAVCLILDIHLGGTSGIDVRRQLSQSGSAVPVIFITGKDSETTRKAAMQVGCTAYLPKPFSAQALVDGINIALGADASEINSAPNNTCELH
jgi:FixJ family two-component response regulator